MAYGFHFELPNGFNYYEGSKTEKKARSKLEIFVENYCRNNDLGLGEIFFTENGKRNILSKYKISLKNGKLVMKELN